MKCIGKNWRVLAGLSLCLALSVAAAWGQPAPGEATAEGPVGAMWGGPYEIYQVRAGDTVENVAARFGIASELIRNLNGLMGSSVITPGQDLAIPLPGRPAQAEAVGPARMVPPRYATVKTPGRIMGEPSGGKFYYEPPAGARLVVKVDRGSHWGVVMVDGSIGWIEKTCLEVSGETIPPDRLEAMLHASRSDVVEEAKRYLDVPYRYGGSLPYNVDCSLLVQTACGARGIALPRTAAAQFEVGRPVNFDELAAGDRLYFVDRSGHVNHTGIYLGSGEFIHASARRGRVAVDSLYDSFYWSRFIGARRS